jgi:hypothetical protein
MANFVSYPKQDSFETTLPTDIDAAQTDIGLNVAPSFALASGECYAVIDYDKPATKWECVSFTGISGLNLTGCTRGLPQYEGGPSTTQTHASGAKVIITDNWQTWKDIADSIATKFDSAGGTITGAVTIDNDLGVTGTVTLTTPLGVTEGGTGAVNPIDARSNLSAAESGANADITSLSALSTPLSVDQGGTGKATITDKSLLLGNGTSAIAELAPGTASQIVISNGTDWVAGDVPPVGTAKKLLSNVNTTDGNDDDVARGSIIVGNSTPKWEALPIGAAGTALVSDGTDVSWGEASPFKYVLSATPSDYDGRIVPLSADSLKYAAKLTTNIHSVTRLSTGSMFPGILTTNAHGMEQYYDYAHYVSGGVDYLIGKTASANSFRRTNFDGSGGTLMSVVGATPTSINAIAYDAVNDYLLVRNGATSAIIRYTVSGTTLTNIGSDITLSVNPVSVIAMSVSGGHIVVLDNDSGRKLKRYNMSGTLVDTSNVGTLDPLIMEEYNGDLYLSQRTTGTTPYMPYFMKIVFPF